jgi:uncharacterized protein (TIGR02246 family)
VNRARVVLTVAYLTAALASWPVHADTPGRLSDADRVAVRKAVDAYRDAWLTNDPSAVMSTLTADAVLMPAHARQPIVGRSAIRAFWFPPDGPATVVTAFDTTVDEIEGSGEVAYARGSHVLQFRIGALTDTAAAVQTVRGAYLMVLNRQTDGRWLISRRMWDDRLSR